MCRLLLIAKRDYIAAVRTKAFILGLIFAPLLFGGSFFGMALTRRNPDVKPRKIAILDRTGIAAISIVNALKKQNSQDRYDRTTGVQVMPEYRFEIVTPVDINAKAQRLALSDRVRRQELFAFVEIGAQTLRPHKDSARSPSDQIAWYSNEGGFNEALRWASTALEDGIRRVRLSQLGIDAGHLDEALDPVLIENLSLITKDPRTGQILTAGKKPDNLGFGAPLILAMLLFMIVLMSSAPMLSGVAEDKMQRVFEMILASATPFEIIGGKIVGAIGVALTSSTFYIAVAIVLLQAMALIGLTPLALVPWFVIYVVTEVIMLSALSAAIGAACGSPQDAQNLKFLVFLPIMIPLFLMIPAVQQPNSAMITALSLVPVFTPILMLMRQAAPGGVPVWQPWVGLAGVMVMTVALSWVASRIFRATILLQGTTPKLAQLVRWAIRG